VAFFKKFSALLEVWIGTDVTRKFYFLFSIAPLFTDKNHGKQKSFEKKGNDKKTKTFL
jgi:hypothetical protein